MSGVVLQGDRDLDLGREEGVFIVVMGVSGTGKTTLGIALSERLGLPYIEGDELHPRENVEKMSSGEPLTDEDRRPWLEVIRERAVKTCLNLDLDSNLERERVGGCSSSSGIDGARDGEVKGGGGCRRRGVVVTCSALKKSYRDILRGKQKENQPLPCQDNQHQNQPLPSSPPPPSSPPTPQTPTTQTYLIWINGSKEVLQDRIGKRQGHFFKASMLDSQLKILESPEGEEGVVVVPLEADTCEQVRIAIEGLRKLDTIL